MSLFSSLNPTNFVNTAVQLGALATPAAPLAIASQTVAMTAGSYFLGQVGQSMGLPPSVVQGAQEFMASNAGSMPAAADSLGSAIGGVGSELNIAQGDQDVSAQDMATELTKLAASTSESPDAKAAKSGGKGQSWLMALAEALGKKLDKMAAEMSSMADQITDKTPSMTAKFSAKTQEFGILMNAATNAIKTIGEAEANSARKG